MVVKVMKFGDDVKVMERFDDEPLKCIVLSRTFSYCPAKTG